MFLFSSHSFSGLDSEAEQELKFSVPKIQTAAFQNWLDQSFFPHPEFQLSTIHTVYFAASSYASRLALGERHATEAKYRLRWYGDATGQPLPVPAYVEVKIKKGSSRWKHREALPMLPAEWAHLPLTDSFYEDTFRRYFPAAVALPVVRLVPLLRLGYLRHRYIHPLFPSSFCLDSRIRCTETSAAELPTANGQLFDMDVFEQKGAAKYPVPALRPLPRFGVQQESVSKFRTALAQFYFPQ